jgi:hypothetical protein
MPIRKSSISGGSTPSGATADRPSSPAIGDQFYNGSLGVLEIYTSAGWQASTGANDFNVSISAEQTSVSLDKEYFSGSYTISSSLSDTNFDIYLFDSSGQEVGYSNTPAISASSSFNKIVIYGGSIGDVFSFAFKQTYIASLSNSDTFAAPYILSISNTDLLNVDDTLTITGGNFDTDVQVWFDGQNSYSEQAKSVVRSSSTSLIVTRPDSLSIADEPFTIRVVNPGVTSPSSSNIHKATSQVFVGEVPLWNTQSGLLPAAPVNQAYSTFMQATDPQGQDLSYSIISGSLISGLTLNSSTGEISGIPLAEANSSFVARVADSSGRSVDRSFTIATSFGFGGDKQVVGNYAIHTFLGNGTFTSVGDLDVEYLVVGGGGGGGSRYMGGGGGAGGFRTNVPGSTSGRNSSPESSMTLSAGQYSIVVGAGGTAASSDPLQARNGNSSSFNLIESLGGGAGGAEQTGEWPGQPGGSGGGDTGYQNGGGGAGQAGQGFDGGNGATYGAGGGGGAGGNGANGSPENGGDGGAGLTSSITGTSVAYAGGGGGASYNGTNVAQGGSGVGGNGAPGPNTTNGGVPTAGAVNRGGGGGGANGYKNTQDAINAASGGSGIVIIRYSI